MSSADGALVRVLLVVEDDLDMRLLIRVTLGADPRLESCGETSTATEAIALARDTGPGLVVLDHFIDGDIMGLQAAPMIKAVAPEARIILFTSHDLSSEARREPAIDAYLRKNDLGELLPTAQRLVGLEPLANRIQSDRPKG